MAGESACSQEQKFAPLPLLLYRINRNYRCYCRRAADPAAPGPAGESWTGRNKEGPNRKNGGPWW